DHHQPAFQRHGGEERHDIGMHQAGAHAHLAEEALGLVAIVLSVQWKHLKQFQPLDKSVLDAVFHAMPGPAGDLEELIPGIRLAEFELHLTGLLRGRSYPAGEIYEKLLMILGVERKGVNSGKR